jgi:outer membrane receptor protein involved in Fe transport
MRLFSTIAVVLLGTSVSGGAAIGQESDERVEEIVVTGSHIRQQTGYEGSSPVAIVDFEDIQAAGAQDLVDVASMLTVNSGTIISQETGNLIGTSQFNVRGLGVGSTLTLLNGRRAGISTVSDASGVLFFDSKQLPLAMISRIDVQTDGASSIYGSDAVGGVVNIITRKGFEGFELSARYQDASNESYALNLASGVRTDNAIFNLYATAYGQTRNHRTDFDWLVERIHGNGDLTASRLTSSQGSPGTYRRASVVGIPTTDRSSATITEGGPRYADPDCEAAFGVLRSGRCRFNFADQVAPIPEENRFQVFSEMDIDVSDNLTFFGEFSFSKNEIQRTQGSNVYRNGLVEGGDMFIPADHPFNFWIDDPNDPGNALVYIGPENWDNNIHTAVDLICECRPQGFEANGFNNSPPWNRDIDLNYYRGMVGFDLQLAGTWGIEANYIYSLSERRFRGENNWNSITLNGSLLDGTFNPFGTSRATPNLVSPKDGVSLAGNSMEEILEIMHIRRNQRRALQQVIDFTASGELFDISAGPVMAAFGVQYRKDDFSVEPDSLNSKGLENTPEPSSSQAGTQSVTAAFGEVIIPATEELEIQLAVRYEDYGGTIGSTTDPKIAARWQLNDTVALRGSFGTAFRGPSIPQTGVASSATFLDDPFGFGDAIVVVSTVGSDQLVPESSENLNFGIVLQPLDDLSIKLDYWRFDYKDLITADEGPQAIVDNDFADDGIPNDPRVIRTGSGQLREVTSFFINTGAVKTDGLDVALDYVLPPSGLGDMQLGLAISYVNSFDVENSDGTTFDGVGSRNFTNQFSSLPEYRANAMFGWQKEGHSLNLNARYIDSYDNDQNAGFSIDSWTVVDARYAYEFELFDGQLSRLTIGARNLFDEDPPSLGQDQRPAYDDRVHDIRGRAAYVEFMHQF